MHELKRSLSAMWVVFGFLECTGFCGSEGSVRCHSQVVMCVADVSVGQSIALRPLADGVFVETSPGVKPGDLVACMRVRIHGIPRFSNIQKFAVVTRVKLQSEAAPAYRPAPPKVEVCMHR